MAKHCSICGKKLGLLEGKIVISDGIVCSPCWSSAGLDMSTKSIFSAANKTTAQLKDLIGIELLKEEVAKSDIKTKSQKASVNVGIAEENKKETLKKQKNDSSDKKSKVSKDEEPKPIDIIIAVDKNKGVSFQCKGKPIINFEDLVNGREMIIGDGFILNESGDSLPEVRIACKFEPPIIDPGLIYYEAGTFVDGAEGRFEIDDPPVNLEEYAKIKRTRNGKIEFTLFIGEQEIGTEECCMKVKPAPEEKMQMLMNAVIYEEEKNASGPVNVFLYAREDSFEIDLMRNPELLYSMYSNGKEQLIGDVYIANETGAILKNVQFEANFTSDILSSVNVFLGDVPACKNVSFEVDDPAIDVLKLEMLTEIETCTATYRIIVDGKAVAESKGKITICPYNQWNAALILLPAYMTPNHPNIINVLQNASKWMLVNGMNPSLEGYQSDAERVDEMVGAVYNAVKEANIIYSNPPASFFGPQRIRLCETVFEQKFATCMDMTILFASCLESFGLHPVLITAPGHIFAGVWLTAKGKLKEPVLSDAKLIQQYIEEGKLIAVECTTMNVGKNIDYNESKSIAANIIKELAEHDILDHECIDVQLARTMGVRPLPMRVHKMTTTDSMAVSEEIKVKTVEKTSAIDTDFSDDIIPVNIETSYIKEEYKAFKEDLSYISIDNFYDKQSKRVIKDAIAEIVAVEGPISQPALIRTLINTTSLGRASKQITEHLDKLVAAADVKITRQAGVRFLWNHGTDPVDYITYRIREQRNPEDICKYELKNAVCYLIQENGPMTKAEIIKAMVPMFGYSRSSKKLEDGANSAIKAARELKAVELSDNGKYVLL